MRITITPKNNFARAMVDVLARPNQSHTAAAEAQHYGTPAEEKHDAHDAVTQILPPANKAALASPGAANEQGAYAQLLEEHFSVPSEKSAEPTSITSSEASAPSTRPAELLARLGRSAQEAARWQNDDVDRLFGTLSIIDNFHDLLAESETAPHAMLDAYAGTPVRQKLAANGTSAEAGMQDIQQGHPAMDAAAQHNFTSDGAHSTASKGDGNSEQAREADAQGIEQAREAAREMAAKIVSDKHRGIYDGASEVNLVHYQYRNRLIDEAQFNHQMSDFIQRTQTRWESERKRGTIDYDEVDRSLFRYRQVQNALGLGT